MADKDETIEQEVKDEGNRQQKIRDFLDTAMKRLKIGFEADNHNRREAIEDLNFLNGDQWDSAEKKRRELAGRPALVINHLPKFVDQIVGDMRQNRARVKVRPVDSKSDVAIAKIRSGLIANIEYLSNAESIYDEAGTTVVECGYGAWRILTRYTEEDPFIQEAYLEGIPNPFVVIMDPNAKDFMYADANWGFILEKMPEDEFREEYPNAEVPAASMEYDDGLGYEHWYQDNLVTVAEYFVRKKETVSMCLMEDGQVLTEDEAAELESDWLMQFGPIVAVNPEANTPPKPVVAKRRNVERYKIRHYKITSAEILSENDIDGEEFPGKYIPIVLVRGKKRNIEGKTHIRGLVRESKDPQRIVNYWECLSLDTPIPTPGGWTTMGEIEAGDTLFDDQGKPCSVLGVSQIHHDRECFRVNFGDGSSIVTDASHLWGVEELAIGYTGKWSNKVIKTSELTPGRHFIWVQKPLDLSEKTLPINPYVLGVWLGDGHSSSGSITAGCDDSGDMARLLTEHGAIVSVSAPPSKNGRVHSIRVKDLTTDITQNGLLNNKHIPDAYLRASYEQRLSLLRGLMDTDGSISSIGNYLCSFSTASEYLADGFGELLSSLGIKYGVSRRERISKKSKKPHNNGKPIFQFSFTAPQDQIVFSLQRKADIQRSKNNEECRRTKRHKIVSVEPVESVPTKCVKVDSPSSLFLAGKSMIPTHNSSGAEVVALAPKNPWVGTPKQFEGFEDDYASANVENFPFLKYNPDPDAANTPPKRVGFGEVPIAIFTQIQRAGENLKTVIGMFNRDVGDVGPEVTGKAILAAQKPGDTATYVYPDNLSKGIAHSGRILNEIIPYIYDSERDIRIRHFDGTESFVPINTTVSNAVAQIKANPGRYSGMDPKVLVDAAKKGGDASFNDIVSGKYDVVVDVGPSYATQRQESAENMLRLINSDPRIMQLAGDIVVRNLDFKDSDELEARLRKTLPPGLAKPREGDEPEKPLPPTPEQEIEKLKLEYQKLKTEAEKERLKIQQVKLLKEAQDVKGNMRKEIIDILKELHAVDHPADSIINGVQG